MSRRSLLIAAIAVLAAGSAAAAMTVQMEMKTVVDPAANTLFAVGGEVDPANGPDAAKTPAARWQEAATAAQALKSAAIDLGAPGQKKPGADWAVAAKALADSAEAARKAAAARDGAGLANAANAMGDTCTACHSKYKQQG